MLDFLRSGDAWLSWLWVTSWQASVLACLVLAVQFIFRLQLNARWHYTLWMLFVVRLLMPVAPPSEASLFNLAVRPPVVETVVVETVEVETVETIDDSHGGGLQSANPQWPVANPPRETAPVDEPARGSVSTTAQTTAPAAVPPRFRSAPHAAIGVAVEPLRWMRQHPLFCVWITGVALLLGRVAWAHFHLHRQLANMATVTDGDVFELFRDCCRDMNVLQRVRLVTTDEVRSPAVGGVWRPKLLISTHHLKSLSSDQLRFIFLHELGHVRRCDVWMHWLMVMLVPLHWFNPFVWFASWRMQIDRELACDELVLSRLNTNETKQYGRTIIALLESMRISRSPIGVAAMVESRRAIRQRIVKIAHYEPESVWQSLLAIVLVLAIGLVGLTSAVQGEKQTSATADRKTVDSTAAEPRRDPVVDPVQFKTSPTTLPAVSSRGAWAPAFSPDGKFLVVGYGHYNVPGELRLWDLTTGTERFVFREPLGVRGVDVSPDGKTFASGSWPGNVVLRDIATGETRLSFREIGGSAEFVRFTPDGKRLVTAGSGGVIRIRDAKTSDIERIFVGHTSLVYWAAQSPDGKTIASCSRDKTVRLWDIATGKLLRTIDHPRDVHCVGYSADGSLVASACYDGQLRFWNAATGALVGEPIKVSQRRLLGVDFSADGERIVTCDEDRNVKLWDARTRELIAESNAHGTTIAGLRLSADGNRVASCDLGMRVKVWDAHTLDEQTTLTRQQPDTSPYLAAAHSPDGRLIAVATEDLEVRILDSNGDVLRTLDEFGDVVNAIAFSPNGKQLATGDFANALKVWDVATGELIAEFDGHTNWVYGVAWSPDGKTLASSGYDKTVKIWEIAGGVERATLTGHSAAVRSVAFSPDSKWLASGSADRTVKIWQVSSWKERRSLTGHGGSIRAVAFSPDGQSLASASEDKTVRLWDVTRLTNAAANTPAEPRATLTGHTDMVWTVAFSPGGKTLASAGFDRTVRTWNVAEGTSRQTLKGHGDVVSTVSFSPDGGSLVSASYDRTLRVWHAILPTASATRVIQEDAAVMQVSPDGRWLVTGGAETPFLKLWNAETGELARRLEGHIGGVTAVAWSPDAETLVSGGADNAIRLWDVETGMPMASTRVGEILRSVCFSVDGKKVASGGDARIVKVWDVADGELVQPVAEMPHRQNISMVAFSPDGKLLGVSTQDRDTWVVPGDVKVWSLDTGQEVGSFGKYTAAVQGLGFSPDGQRLVCYGHFGAVRFWDVKTRRELMSLRGPRIVSAAVFLADGDHLVVAGKDGTVTHWDVAQQRPVVRFAGHKKDVSAVAASADGVVLASASRDGTVKLWTTAEKDSK